MNPILPNNYFIPDAEARVYNGRIYLYGSYDIPFREEYCSYEYHVFSSEDMVTWTDHGRCFSSYGNMRNTKKQKPLYAPDSIYKNGKYYLYYCLSDGSEGVAESRFPHGPFENARPVKIADGDGIDPAIFIDDDGKAYYFWGQFRLRGARLADDMETIIEETINRNIIDEDNFGFHEGSSLRKHNGRYYLVYTDISRGKATCMSYAVADSPLGPYKKGGVIIDNLGCDPGTWNNHGSIAEFNGQWYIFYHRSSMNSKFNRRVCVEPIYFNEDGSINEVEMTTQGAAGPIPAVTEIEGYRACLLNGHVHSKQCYSESGLVEYLTNIHNNDWAAYKYLDFSKNVTSFHVTASSATYGGKIEIRIDSPDGIRIGECMVNNTGSWGNWNEFECRVDEVSGVHALYLVFKGVDGNLMNLKKFCFRYAS